MVRVDVALHLTPKAYLTTKFLSSTDKMSCKPQKVFNLVNMQSLSDIDPCVAEQFGKHTILSQIFFFLESTCRHKRMSVSKSMECALLKST